MSRYFGMMFGTGYTNAELEKAAKFDVICLHPSSFGPFIDPTLITRVRSRNGSAKILVYIDAAWASLSGSTGALKYAGNPNSAPPYNLPYNSIEFWKSYRCYNQNQYAMNPQGQIVTGQTLGTGWGLLDYTDQNPIGTDGKNFRQAFVSYLVTGVAEGFDIDGFFFDNMDDYHTSGLNQTIDFNRDGVADTSGEKAMAYSGSMLQFAQELRAELNNTNKTEFQIWYKGGFTGYSSLTGKYYDSFPYDFTNAVERTRWTSLTGEISRLEATGMKTAINAKISINIDRSDYSNANAGARQISDIVLATAILFSSMFHLGNTTRSSIWFVDSIHRKFEVPLTNAINTGSVWIRCWEDGLGALNTGASASKLFGYSLNRFSGVSIAFDTNRDYYIHSDQFGHGFYGPLGERAGSHLNYPGEKVSYQMKNRIEIGIENIKSIFLRSIGAFHFSGSLYPVCQIFSGDGLRRNFDLNPGIDKYMLMDFVNVISGAKNPYFHTLARRNKLSNTYYGLEFDQAPSGIFALVYTQNKGSYLNSNARLTGARWN